jgi:hypothetical protein
MLHLSRDLVGGELDAGVARMARLPASLAPRRLALEMRPRAGRGTRRRPGGVAGVLVGARLEVGDLALQLADRRLQCRRLITQERDLAVQKGNVGPDDRWEGGPNLRG